MTSSYTRTPRRQTVSSTTAILKVGRVGRSHSIFWVFISSRGMVKVARCPWRIRNSSERNGAARQSCEFSCAARTRTDEKATIGSIGVFDVFLGRCRHRAPSRSMIYLLVLAVSNSKSSESSGFPNQQKVIHGGNEAFAIPSFRAENRVAELRERWGWPLGIGFQERVPNSLVPTC